jgi:hypothetical protein
MTGEDGERLYSTAEVARIIGKDRVTIWFRARKIGVGRKVGRVLAFTADEVEAIKNAPDRRRREHRRR